MHELICRVCWPEADCHSLHATWEGHALSGYLHSRARRQVFAAVAYATIDMRLPCMCTDCELQLGGRLRCFSDLLSYHFMPKSAASGTLAIRTKMPSSLTHVHLPVVLLIAQRRQPHDIRKAIQQQAVGWHAVASCTPERLALSLQLIDMQPHTCKRAHSSKASALHGSPIFAPARPDSW